ncbi:TRAP transporter small permease [Pseudorhizobium halotolerans]|uniref:TRAP transporter small permease protein n=1 Tax=Pseudorhizobium halotolerans TaxID=1233081 RepID=A0ABN7K2E6_9HYPH|nr:TRAP transporter small permease [Pseudorhizobium halotolerans]
MTTDEIDWSRGPRPFALAIQGLDSLNALLKWIVGGLLALATTAVAIQIVVRFILGAIGVNIAAPWTEEVARYSSIWAVFLGVAVLTRQSGLIAVEMFPQLLPKRPGTAVKIAATLISMAFFSAVFLIGLRFTHEGLMETSPVMRLRMVWIHAAIPVGSGLAILNMLAFLLECAFFGRNAVEVEDPEMRLE